MPESKARFQLPELTARVDGYWKPSSVNSGR